MKGDKTFRVLSPTAILGYGYPLESFAAGLEREPDLIAVDAGSTDPGPYYLGSGKSFTDRAAVRRDLLHLLREGTRRKIPVVAGTAGGCGARPHLEWCREIVAEIAAAEKLSFRLGVISTDLSRETVLEALAAGRVTPLPNVPPLDPETVGQSVNIVAQAGVEPFIEAFKAGCEVILCGRAYDPACFAALPIHRGFDTALATHLGKIVECSAIAAEPGSGADSVLGTLGPDSFVLESLNPARKFTRASTAAHSLYEKSDPFRLPGPGGTLVLSDTSFTELPGGRVEVKGTRWEPTVPCRLKIEGARRIGYRTVSLAGARDPRFIEGIDAILDGVRAQVEANTARSGVRGDLFFRVYGRDGIMGDREPLRERPGHEVAILISALSPTPEEADTICSLARSTMLHFGYEGRLTTAGNLAFPFSPSDMRTGEVFEFSIYHLMTVDDPAAFPLEIIDFKAGRRR